MGPLRIKKVHQRDCVVAMLLAMTCAAVAFAQDIPTITHPSIHFESDRTSVVSEDLVKLNANVDWLSRYSRAVVILEGHCDQSGGDDYNMELGDRRAREVKSYLIERGIAPDRVIMVVSFGEKRPVDPGESPAALQKNRRVEFVLR